MHSWIALKLVFLIRFACSWDAPSLSRPVIRSTLTSLLFYYCLDGKGDDLPFGVIRKNPYVLQDHASLSPYINLRDNLSLVSVVQAARTGHRRSTSSGRHKLFDDKFLVPGIPEFKGMFQ
jgi:hypothetical protein